MLITQTALLQCVVNMLAGELDTLNIHLFTAYDGTQEPSPANFTEATGGWYSAQAVDWVDPVIYIDNSVGAFFRNVFQGGGTSSAPQSPQVISGYYITDSANTSVVLWEQFANPWPIFDSYSYLPINGELHFNNLLPVGVTYLG